MAIKKYRAFTPGRRQMSVVDYSGLTKKRPEKGLLVSKKNNAGRNNQGRITVRHRGGGHKRLYRIVDFLQTDKLNISGTIQSIEYDPNRSAFIALVFYADGEKRYVLAGIDMKVGDQIICGEKVKYKTGNRMQLKNIPEGYAVYNIELQPGKGGQLVRGAGLSAKVLGQEGELALVALPSGETRYIRNNCYATLGQLSNIDHANMVIGKAGRTRWMRKRPEVRGKVMNPVDHPHGGGEGSNSIGLKHPKTPWGKPALGVKTRRNKKASTKLIVKKR